MSTEGRKHSSLVGQFLRQRREGLALSQKALGQKFSPPVTTQFISNVERGVTPLPAAHIPTLVRELKLDESELIAILEREYAQKISDKIQRQSPGANPESAITVPQLKNFLVEERDAEFIRALYQAYSLADAETKNNFASLCEKILGVTKSG